MTAYQAIQQSLLKHPKTWLVTGVAGFIGSNLLEKLLKLDQQVIGLDNFSTGHPHNLHDVQNSVTPTQWRRFKFIEGDIRDLETCQRACRGGGAGEDEGTDGVVGTKAGVSTAADVVAEGSGSLKHVDYVLQQAALGSVPRSLENPIATNQNNIDGFLNMLVAARDAGVKRLVFAASSSTYGDHPALPKVENQIGKPLSPYAVTKLVNELYADVFTRSYGLSTIGLRYFNVFGPRQDPNGAYAAVIPRWIAAMMNGVSVNINGDGQTSRDFCFIDNAVQANILAAATETPAQTADRADSASISLDGQVFNVAYGGRTTLTELYNGIKQSLQSLDPSLQIPAATYRDFRAGDIRHSQADISKAQSQLGYAPSHDVYSGLAQTVAWFKLSLAN